MLNSHSRALLKELDSGRAMAHVRLLTEKFPRRISGTGDDSAAAAYCVEQLSVFGLEAYIQDFEAYNSIPGTAKLQVLSPLAMEFPAAACGHILSTPAGGIVAELIYVGSGGVEDYAGLNVAGKAVLAEVSYTPPTPEKAHIAMERGVAAMVLVNWGESDCDAICMRALKAVWGNPTPETWGQMPQMAALTVSRRSGEKLMQLCQEGPVQVWLQAECERSWTMLQQPVADLRGDTLPDEFLLVGGHLDAWEPGVTCNATGDGVMLEIARALAAGPQPARSLKFVFFNGHEIAEAAGSTWLVDHYWDLIRQGCVGYLNIDSPGLLGGARFQATAAPELIDFSAAIAEEVLREPVERRVLTKTGDQSFLGIGVPSLTGRYSYDQQTLQMTHGATLGWWNHSTFDTVDRVDEQQLGREMAVNAAWISQLLNDPVLPHDPTALVDDLQARLAAYLSLDARLGLQGVAKGLADLRTVAVRLRNPELISDAQHNSQQARVLNAGLRTISQQLTSAFRSAVPRWEQDIYGSVALGHPIPRLASFDEFTTADAQTQYLLHTKLVRARNLLADAVVNAAAVAQNTLCEVARTRREQHAP